WDLSVALSNWMVAALQSVIPVSSKMKWASEECSNSTRNRSAVRASSGCGVMRLKLPGRGPVCKSVAYDEPFAARVHHAVWHRGRQDFFQHRIRIVHDPNIGPMPPQHSGRRDLNRAESAIGLLHPGSGGATRSAVTVSYYSTES